MSNNKTNRNKMNQKSKNMGHEGGSGTSNYHRNKRLVLSGETFRSRKRTGPEKAPSSYRARY